MFVSLSECAERFTLRLKGEHIKLDCSELWFQRRSLTLHGGLQGVDGVNLRDDDASAEPTQSLNAAFTHVTVAGDHGHFPGDHDVGGSLDAVDQTLSAAVQVIELTLHQDVTQVTHSDTFCMNHFSSEAQV